MVRFASLVRFTTFFLLSLTIIGCGGKHKPTGLLTGKVTYKGQPVNGGAIALYRLGDQEKLSKSGKGDAILIPLSQDGTFRSSDVPVGEYRAVLQPSKGSADKPPKEQAEKMSDEDKARWEAKRAPATIKIPEKYTKSGSNDLTIIVKEGDNSVPLELKD